MARGRAWIAAAALLAACEEEVAATPPDVCTPVLDALDPGAGPVAGGTAVTLRGLWVATEYGTRDVVVTVGGRDAEVTGVFRGDGCASCDACTAEALRCEECERVCRGEAGWTDPETGDWSEPVACLEWVAFTSPTADAAGPAAVLLTNGRGSASGLDFEYE